MGLTIAIRNQQKKILLSPARIRQTARKILHIEGVRDGDLSVAFVTNSVIRRLNRQYLGRDEATDVLAFDLTAGIRRRPGRLDGEIVISTGMAAVHARRFQTAPYRETVLYLIHGILHLLGYDDHAPADTRKMQARQEFLLGRVYKGRERS